MFEDPKKPDKGSPVVEAVLIAFFTAVATKAVDRFFAWLEKREKKELEKDKKKEDTKNV